MGHGFGQRGDDSLSRYGELSLSFHQRRCRMLILEQDIPTYAGEWHPFGILGNYMMPSSIPMIRIDMIL